MFKNSGPDKADYVTQSRSMAQYFVGRVIDKRIALFGQQIADLATVLQRTAGNLAAPGSVNATSRVCTVVAIRLADAGIYLKNSTGKTLSNDCERLVNAYPWLVSSAAFLVGFVTSRVLRSSSQVNISSDDLTGTAQTGNAEWVNAAPAAALI